MDEHEFTEALRQQLVEAAERRNDEPPVPLRRRPAARWPLAVAAAAVVALVVVGFGVFRDDRTVAADVRVSLEGDELTLQLSGHDVRAKEIVDAARTAGLDVTVSEVPVGPSNVGRLVRSESSELPPVLEMIGPDGASFLGFRLPRDWPGTLHLTLGRAAEPGEPFIVSSDALQSGEALECRNELLGADLAEVAAQLRGEGFDVRTFALPTPGEVLELGVHGTWKVAKIEALGPQELWIDATVDGQWPFPENEPVPSAGC